MPTIWPWRRAEERVPVRFLAETSDLFPPTLGVIDESEAFAMRGDPFDDPTRCCEACEDLTARIGQARQVVDGAEALLADLARELVELTRQHEEARQQ